MDNKERLVTLDTHDTERRQIFIQSKTNKQNPPKNTQRKPNRWATQSTLKNWGWTKTPAKDEQFRLLIRYPQYYTHSPVHKLIGDTGKNKICVKRLQINCHLSYGYFVMANNVHDVSLTYQDSYCKACWQCIWCLIDTSILLL